MQIRQYLKAHYLIPAIYLLIVLVGNLFLFAFNFDSAGLFLMLFVLTLPCSILAGFFILGALHLGDETGIVILFMICASINALVYYFAARPERNVDEVG